MSAIESIPSHKVLKNRGIPVLVHTVEPRSDGVHWDRVFDANDDPVMETVYVKFTNLTMAGIEDRWGGIDGWQEALDEKQWATVVDTLATAWEMTREQAGIMLIDDEMPDYATAIGASFMQANGASGDAVVRTLVQGVESSKRLRVALQEEMDKAIAETETSPPALPVVAEPVTPTSPSESPSGSDYSQAGSNSDEVLTSSGT